MKNIFCSKKLEKNSNLKSGFTLAEVMIVFTVIGILTAILVPALFAASPDQQKLRAKKAFNTLNRAVESLTNSGPYDTNDGLLDATRYVTTANDRNRFFCSNLSEILNVKKVDCTQANVIPATASNCTAATGLFMTVTSNKPNYETLQSQVDITCKCFYDRAKAADTNYNFITSDNILWGVQLTDFSNTSTVSANGVNMPSYYGVVCFDTDKRNSADYVYGAAIRRDGKIVVGTKLQTLIEQDYKETVE